MAQSSHADIGISSATLQNLANKLKGVLAEAPHPPKPKNKKNDNGAQKKKERPNAVESIQQKDNKQLKNDRKDQKQGNSIKQAEKVVPKSQGDSQKRPWSEGPAKKGQRQGDVARTKDVRSNGRKSEPGNERKGKGRS